MDILKEIALILLGAIRAILAYYPTSNTTKIFGYLDDIVAFFVGGDKVKKK